MCSDGGANDNATGSSFFEGGRLPLQRNSFGNAVALLLGAGPPAPFDQKASSTTTISKIFNPSYLPDSDPWLRIAADNQGLIDRIKSGLATNKMVFAGAAALCSEYDVVNDMWSSN
jgi:hypothetical protein